MIIGRRHEYCGRINWAGKDECTCRPYTNYRSIFKFTDVVLDNPLVEDLGKKIADLAQKLGMRVEITYDVEHENEDCDTVGAVIINGWVIIYAEKIAFDTILGTIHHDGFALDVMVIEHNYPSGPDFADYSRIKTSTYAWNIISHALKLIWENNLNNILEGIGMEEMNM